MSSTTVARMDPTHQHLITAGSVWESYQNLILAQRPRMYLPLTETTGTTAFDVSNHGNNGTLHGGITLGQPGPLAGDPALTAMTFDGSTGYIQIPSLTSLVNPSFSFIVWFTISQGVLVGTQQASVGGANGSWNPVLWVGTNGVLYGDALTQNANYTLSNNIVLGPGWHCAVLTCANQVTATLYVDGTLVQQITDNPLNVSQLNAWQIGVAYGNGWQAVNGSWFYAQGSIGQFAFFTMALDPATIHQLYLAGSNALHRIDATGHLYTGTAIENVFQRYLAVDNGHSTGEQVTDPDAVTGVAWKGVVGTSSPGALLTWGQYDRSIPNGPAILGVRAKVADNTSSSTVLQVQPFNGGTIGNTFESQWGTNQWKPFTGQDFTKPNTYQWIWIPFYANTPTGAYEWYTEFTGITDVWLDEFVVVTSRGTSPNLAKPDRQRNFVLGASLVESASYTNTMLSLNPVAYLPLQMSRNGTTPDISGHQNTGTLAGGVTPNAPGPFGTMGDVAMAFNGSTGYINVPQSPSNNITTNTMTMIAWIYLLSTTLGIILNKENQYEIGISETTGNGSLACAIMTGTEWSWVAVTPPLSLKTWHLAIATYNGSQIQTYVDGKLAANSSWTGNIISSGRSVDIGARGGRSPSSFYGGSIAHVAILDYALTPSQVALLWNAGQGLFLDATIPA